MPSDKAFEINFESTVSKENDLQFLMNLLSLLFSLLAL